MLCIKPKHLMSERRESALRHIEIEPVMHTSSLSSDNGNRCRVGKSEVGATSKSPNGLGVCNCHQLFLPAHYFFFRISNSNVLGKVARSISSFSEPVLVYSH